MSSTGDEVDGKKADQLAKIAEMLSAVEMCPEESLAWLTNVLVELAYAYGMPMETLSWAIKLKYTLIVKRSLTEDGAGPRDVVH